MKRYLAVFSSCDGIASISNVALVLAKTKNEAREKVNKLWGIRDFLESNYIDIIEVDKVKDEWQYFV